MGTHLPITHFLYIVYRISPKGQLRFMEIVLEFWLIFLFLIVVDGSRRKTLAARS